MKSVILFFVSFFVISLSLTSFHFAFGNPSTIDPNFTVEKVVDGLDFPVQMDFLGNDILVIEKNDGNVRIIHNDQLQDKLILHFDVQSEGFEGLLGIKIIDSDVYFYVTQFTQNNEEPEINRIYQYKWDGNNLIDGKIINELPGSPTAHDHVGGVFTSDNNKNVYAVIGDVYRRGLLQNSLESESHAVKYQSITMNDTTSSFGVITNNERQLNAEFVSPTSQLVGKQIDAITLKLRKIGSPTGTAQIGVFNDDLSVKKLFGTIEAGALFEYYSEFSFSIPKSELYTIEDGDKIGIKYPNGDNTNYIETVIDTDTAEPFDGTNSYYTYYTNEWLSFMPHDMYMVLGQTSIESVLKPDDSGIILRVGLDNSVKRPSLTEYPFSHYYGMGIRNSFGIAFDPITGNMWDTENGPDAHDEINLVSPGFNSGWSKIMGPATQSQVEALPRIDGFQYSDPEFSWEKPVAPTGIAFTGEKWGDKYKDVLFVADFNTGSIYKFKLNSTRTGFDFKSTELKDLVANKGDSIKEIIFGTGFAGISDIELSSTGDMYVLSFENGGTLYKISQSDGTKKIKPPTKQLEEGLTSSTISCIDGYVLVVKNTNNSVACVQPSTAVHLIERQWGVEELNPAKNCYSAPKPSVDWSNCNFSFRDLSGINLEGVNLSGADVVGADFSNSVLSNGNFSNSNMVFSNFTGSDLSSSSFVTSRLLYADFHNSDMTKVILNSANLSYAVLTDANLSQGSLNSAYFTNANLASSNISNGTLIGTILHFANMTGADLSNTDLKEANFYFANLNNVTLSGCINHDLCK